MRKVDNTEEITNVKIKRFLDMISPSIIKFNTDYFICGNTFRSVWVLREYPTQTKEQAILRRLGEKDGVTLKIYTRNVNPTEEKKILVNATNKNRMNAYSTNDLKQTITAESNLQDVANIISQMHKNKEPLFHVAVFIEIIANDFDKLKLLQTEVLTELIRSKLNVDRLYLRQKQGFLSIMPNGRNMFLNQFERVLPASSVANLFPFAYSGKTDEQGFYIGKDMFGSNVIVDFNKREEDKTNGNIIILGNSGQGKSYLLKLIITNLRQSGKKILCLDPEEEFVDLAKNLGGSYIDFMSGEYKINVLEPKVWNNGEEEDIELKAFQSKSIISSHIAFLKDFFKSYKDFKDKHIDTIEIFLCKLYEIFGLDDEVNFKIIDKEDFPILSDLYNLIEDEFLNFKEENKIYNKEILQEILLGLHSMCKGSESRFFNGYTYIKDTHFLVFGVKGLLNANQNIKNAMLFNILSYMSNELLSNGNAVCSIDEFYLFLSNLTTVEYVRSFMKRVRKKESQVILSSQNIEDYLLPNIAEYTKPLFSIPTHKFLFYPGTINEKDYIDMLQLEKSEFELIKYPKRACCLFKCGNEVYNLVVKVPKYKSKLFGNAGGN